jgi:hypothetical protein
MTDIFREVDEELRRSQLEQLWKKYGSWIVALAVGIVLAVAGYRGWDYYRTKMAEAAGARFQTALDLAADGKGEEAERLLAAIAGDAPSGYRIIARFRLAGETGKRDAEAGAKAFRDLAADSSVGAVMQDLARLRAAMLASGKGDPKPIMRELEPLAAAGNPWRGQAREMLGVLAIKAGDYEAAGRWFDQIIVDPETPGALRRRAQELSGLVSSGPLKPKS